MALFMVFDALNKNVNMSVGESKSSSMEDVDQEPKAPLLAIPEGVINVDFGDESFLKILDDPKHPEYQDV